MTCQPEGFDKVFAKKDGPGVRDRKSTYQHPKPHSWLRICQMVTQDVVPQLKKNILLTSLLDFVSRGRE